MTYELDTQTESLVLSVSDVAKRWSDQAWDVRQLTAIVGERPTELVAELAQAGYAGLMVPAEHGGSGAGVVALALTTQALSAAGLPPQLWPLTHAAAALIDLLGTEAQRAEYLPRIASGDDWWAMAVTEPDAGHDFRSVATNIEDRGDTVRVTGSKCFISGADVADNLLLIGRFDNGLGAVVVPADAPGVSRSAQDMGGREGLQQWALELDVELPRSALIGEATLNLGRLQAGLLVERIAFLSAGIGIAEYALAQAVDWAKERIVFGDRPIGAYQAISHPLAQAYALVDGARLHLRHTAERIQAGHAPGEVTADVMVSALLVAQAATESTDRAIQTCGGSGWIRERNLLDGFLDARALRSSPVAEELVRSTIAERVLGLPRDR